MDLFGSTLAPYLWAHFGRSDRSTTLIEYALELALIGVVCVVALAALAARAGANVTNIGNSLL